jgi:hypothetical protein
MRSVFLRMAAITVAAVIASCGGSDQGASNALTDGSHALQSVAAETPITPPKLPEAAAAAAAAMMVDPTNLMDWAELRYPQFFPSHQQNKSSAPYIYRYYPETNTYVGVDGVVVRVLGPAFGRDILTVGVLSDFVCQVFPENCAPPTANAGASQQVLVGSGVTLSGIGSSDPNGQALSYSWILTSKPTGSRASLVAAQTALPTFIADVAGAYVASLTVSDSEFTSAAAFTTVTAVAANVAPVANAGGSRSVVTGTAVFLSGSASSDQNGDALTYRWTLTIPSGSGAYLSNATSVGPYFTPDIAGAYVATLVVNDGKVDSQPASVSVTATSQSTYCCKHCTTGQPCGDTCISRTNTCHVGGGCAC